MVRNRRQPWRLLLNKGLIEPLTFRHEIADSEGTVVTFLLINHDQGNLQEEGFIWTYIQSLSWWRHKAAGTEAGAGS